MKRTYFLLSYLLLFSAAVSAQQRRGYQPSISVGIQVVQPEGEFRDFYTGNPAGISAQLVGPLAGSPILVGVSGAWTSMDSKTEDIYVNVGSDKNGNEYYEDGTMSVKSNNNRYLMVGRLNPFPGGFQLYGDALVGFETFSTKTRIELKDGSSTTAPDKHRHHWDAGATLGWAVGTKIKLSNDLFLEGRFEKLEGGRTTFVDPETIEVTDEGELSFETVQSKTNKWTVQVGISFEF